MEIQIVPNKIGIYPLFDNTYVANVQVSKNFYKSCKIGTIIILDVPGSMERILPTLKNITISTL